MKITVIVPTGEVRRPKDREWYLGWLNQWVMNVQSYTMGDFPIGVAHELEAPEGSYRMYCSFFDKAGTTTVQVPLWIDLPSPKKKVKKWNWCLPMSCPQEAFVPNGWYTEDTIKRLYPNREYYHKIPETEIEVEE